MYCQGCGGEITNKDQFCGTCGKKLKARPRNLLYFGILLLLAIVISTPFGISYYTNQIIKEKQSYFKDLGIRVNIQEPASLMETTRKVSVIVDNGQYFANYIFKLIKGKFPEYEKPLKTVFYEKGVDWEEILNGSTFEGQIDIDYFLMNNHKLELSLKRFSDEIMRHIRKDKEASRLILPLLDRSVLSCDILLDKAGQFISVALKNINEDIDIDKGNVNIEFFDPKYSIKDNTSRYDFSRFYTSVKERNEKINYQMDKFSYTIEGNNHLLNSLSGLQLGSLLLNTDNNHIHFGFEDLIWSNKLSSNQNNVDFNQSLSVKNMDFSAKKEGFSFKGLKTNFSVIGLDKKKISRVMSDYNDKNFDIKKYGEYEVNNLFSLLNDNVKINYSISMDGLDTPKTKSTNAGFVLIGEILQNDLDLKDISNKDDILKTINLTALLKIDNKTVKDLIQLDKTFKTIFNSAYVENEYNQFFLEIKDSKIDLNGFNEAQIANRIGDIPFENNKYSNAISFYKYAVENGDNSAKFRLAYSYNEIGNYDKAIENYLSYLESTDYNIAMYNLSSVYRNGKKDYINAIKWAKKAVANEYKDGYFTIAYSYDMLNDYKNAIIWYKMAIKNNVASEESLWNLGVIYDNGKGKITKDKKKAFRYYLDAARLGFQDAKEQVAYMYENGIGVEKNYKKAKYWKGDKNALTFEEMVYELRKKEGVIKSGIAVPLGIYIVVGVTSREKPSQKFIDLIVSKKYNYKLLPLKYENKKITKILLGPYQSSEEAKLNLDKVKKDINKDAFIYRVK